MDNDTRLHVQLVVLDYSIDESCLGAMHILLISPLPT